MTHVVRIGSCYSGILGGRRSNFRKILLATPRALKRFSQQPEIQRVVASIQEPVQRSSNIFQQNGLVKEDFVNAREEVTVGLRLEDPTSNEESIYAAGKRTLLSMACGIHRRIALKRMGLTADREIDLLPPNQYAAMLADIEQRHSDPTFSSLASVKVADIPFHVIEKSEAGKVLTFSRSMLEEAQIWAHLIEV